MTPQRSLRVLACLGAAALCGAPAQARQEPAPLRGLDAYVARAAQDWRVRARIFQLVIGQGLRLSAVGIGVGLLGSL